MYSSPSLRMRSNVCMPKGYRLAVIVFVVFLKIKQIFHVAIERRRQINDMLYFTVTFIGFLTAFASLLRCASHAVRSVKPVSAFWSHPEPK